jgi:protein O-mannosyl-transferase
MLWPTDLTVYYLHPGENVSLTRGLAGAVLLVAISLLVLYQRKRRPYLLVGWLWYLGTLVPVAGIVQVGPIARADRYTYVPLIGLFIALSWGAAGWLGRWRIGCRALALATVVLLLACTAVTAAQLRHWRNSETLWARALQVSGDDPRLHLIVAETYLRDGEAERAVHHAEKAVNGQSYNWLVYQVLAVALSRQGRLDEAVQSMAEAVARQPDSVEVRNQMVRFLWLQGNIPAAYEQLAVVARLEPDSKEALHYRGTVLQRQGKLVEAIRCFQQAVRLAPGSPLYRVDLASALADQGTSTFAAASEYAQALQTSSSWPAEIDRLARILASDPDPRRRDGVEAVRRARQVCFVSQYKHGPYLETLAAAYAEAGRFKEAIETAERALELARAARDNELVERLEVQQHRYKKGQPFRMGKER